MKPCKNQQAWIRGRFDFSNFFKWRLSGALCVFVCALLSGCIGIPKTEEELRIVTYLEDSDVLGKRLLVFLPGRNDEPEDFYARGFLGDLRASNHSFDVWAVDSHLGYYYEETVAEFIKRDVIQPARDLGYEEIWVVGISLGGLGALLVEKEFPGSWDGMILLAPYLGKKKELLELFSTSGEEEGMYLDTDVNPESFTSKLWSWLSVYRLDVSDRPIVYLGYGESDRFEIGIRYLIPLLPEGSVYNLAGGHRWSVWRTLWRDIIESETLQ